MSRTIEVGRAVLGSTSTQLQLWLTTLITISPQNDSLDFQQLNQPSLLEFLLQRKAWMRRGNDMHLELKLTMHGEPLPRKEKEQLAAGIAAATVWNQLNLEATVPVKDMGSPPSTLDGSRIRIDISHQRREDERQSNKRHRIGSNVPFADVNPPEGVAVIALESIHFVMDFVRNNPRWRNIGRKRLRDEKIDQDCQAKEQNGERNLIEIDMDKGLNDDDCSDDLLLEIPEIRVSLGNESSEDYRPKCEKLKRVSTSHKMETLQTADLAGIASASGKKRKRRAITSELVFDKPSKVFQIDLLEICKLANAALRISIYGSFSKVVPDVKLVANTSGGSLSDLCPTLWSPGYLRVMTMSQRAHLLPTISRSLGRVANFNAILPSLQDRVAKLVGNSTLLHSDCMSVTDPPDQIDHREIIRSFHARLWQTMQSKLPIKATRALATFCNLEMDRSSAQDSDNLQDEDEINENFATINDIKLFRSEIHSDLNPDTDDAGTRCGIYEDTLGVSADPGCVRIPEKTEIEIILQEEDGGDLLLTQSVDVENVKWRPLDEGGETKGDGRNTSQDEPKSTFPRFQAIEKDFMAESSPWIPRGDRDDSEDNLDPREPEDEETLFEEHPASFATSEDADGISSWKLEGLQNAIIINDAAPPC